MLRSLVGSEMCIRDSLKRGQVSIFLWKLITGIEYRQMRFFLGSKVSLPSYFLSIRSLLSLSRSTIIAFYCPGPSFFTLPTYYELIFILIGHPGFNMQRPPRLLSPITSPVPASRTQRDPRLRKTSLHRAQSKHMSTLKMIATVNKEIQQLTNNRRTLEDQLEAIRPFFKATQSTSQLAVNSLATDC